MTNGRNNTIRNGSVSSPSGRGHFRPLRRTAADTSLASPSRPGGRTRGRTGTTPLRQPRLWQCVLGFALLALLCLLPGFASVAHADELLKDAFSREFSLFAGSDGSPLIKDIASREVSLFVGSDGLSPCPEAVSREISLLVTTPGTPQRVTQLGITVSPTGDAARLDWSGYDEIAQHDVARYRIYVMTAPFRTVSNMAPAYILPAGASSFTITNLGEWQDHYFAVVAEDALGSYDASVSYSAAYVLAPQAISRELSLFVGAETAPPCAQAISREMSLLVTTLAVPDRITQLGITVTPTGDGAALDWSAYNELAQRDVVRYNVYVGAAPFAALSNLTPCAVVPAGSFALGITNLAEWQDHYFAVVPVDGLGGYDPVVNYAAAYVLAPQAMTREVSLFVGAEPLAPYPQATSRELSVLVPDTTVPAPVAGLTNIFTAAMSRTAFSAIDLDWSSYNELAQRDVARYRIYAGPSFFTDVTGMSPVAYVPAGTLRQTVGGLHGWGIYYMAVVAEDALGQWDPAVFSRSAQASLGALGEAQNLTATSFASSITLAWTPPAQVDAFLAHYNLYVDGATHPIAVDKGAARYDLSGLQPAAGYALRLATVDTFGTESAGVSVPAATLLDNPGDVAAQSFDSMVRLKWSHVEPNSLVKHYAVYRSNTSFTSVAGMTPVLTTRGLRADIGGLENGTPGFFAVTTVNIADGQNPGVQAVAATPGPVSGRFADLVITHVAGPSTAYSGQTISVNWCVTNTGTASTSTREGGPISLWTDRVVLSPDGVYGNANDVLLTNVTHTGALNPGGSYTGATSLQLPTNLLGNFHIFVMVNAAVQVYEHLDSGTNLGVAAQQLVIGPPVAPFITQQPLDQAVFQGYPASFSVGAAGSPPLAYQWQHGAAVMPEGANATLLLANAQFSDAGSYVVQIGNPAGTTNSRAAILTVYPPPPDVLALGLQAPTNLSAGQPVSISWLVTNAGLSGASAPWQETLLLAANPICANATTLFTLTNGEPLSAAGSVSRTQTVILPDGLSGAYWLAIQADSANQLAEGYGETNNLFVNPQPIQVVSPDLEVCRLTSADPVIFGQPIAVTWVVTNTGTGPAPGSWSDRLWLSSASNSLAGATSLAAAANASSLQFPGSYTNGATVTLPLNAQSQPGGYWLIAQADANHALPETDEGNNLHSIRLELALPPLPDLAAGLCVAPASGMPGETIRISWGVTNLGPAGVTDTAWRETLSITNVGTGGAPVPLCTLTFTNTLGSGEFVMRTQSLTLPVDSETGNMRLIVAVDSAGDLVEASEANNYSMATNVTSVAAGLTLSARASLQEGESAQATVTRNGSRASAVTITVTNRDSTELSFDPTLATAATTVVIPAGSASAQFLVRAVRDGLVDGPQQVLLSASATNFIGSVASLVVLDADLPRLTLTFLTNAVWEGESVGAVVARDLVTTDPLTVAVQSSSPGQLSPPVSVTIPGGAAAVGFTVLAVDDNLVESTREYTITASTSGFEGSAASVFILDNDLPGVAVTLASGLVSEGAGPQATMATVTRGIASARALAVDLESTNTAAALVPDRVVIPANQYSVSFPVAAVNDDLVNGPRTTLIRPFVVASGSNVRLLEGGGAILTVTDDDGPTIKVVAEKKVVAEGLDPATRLTVSRNTPSTNSLTVALTSTDTTEATVPASATIPVGTNAVVVSLRSVADGVTDGDQTVAITASAPGYVAGTETIMVSDRELPDLVVPAIHAPATAETDSYVSIGYRVVNQGLGPAGTNFLVRVYLAKDSFGNAKTLLAQGPFEGTIPAGLFFEQNLTVRTPLAAGDYWVVAEADANRQIAEMSEDNNITISAEPIAVRAAYGAWVQTPLTTAQANTPVPLSGRATNAFGAGVQAKLVNIHILVRGTERVISALTDADGNFATTWQPLPGEGGFYQIFATHPGVSSAPVQNEFRLVGLRADPASAAFTVVEGATRSGSVAIENLSDVPLTGVTVSVVSAPAGLNVTAKLAGGDTIAGGVKASLSYTVAPATGTAYGNVLLRVDSTEGASVDVTLAVSVEPLRPRLAATPARLVAGMARGRQSVVEFKLANEGGVPTGPITVALPPTPWLALAATNPMPPLAPGETNAMTVTLLLTPATNLALGAYEGNIALNSSNASLNLPFTFRALSEARGDLLITAVDELTYYGTGSPNLAGATVTVRDAAAQTNVASGITATNGQFFVNQLQEGYYEIELTADKHTTYRQTRLLVAGQTNEVSAFLSRQVVSYTWTVEPIEIEDRYKITVETTFETVVPIPVVTIEPSVIDLAEITAAETQVMVTITNHGLLAANNTRLSFPTHPLWSFEPLLTQVGTLPARSGLTIPLIIRKIASPESISALRQTAKTGDLGPCVASAHVCWELPVCGKMNTYCGIVYFPNARSGCGSPSPTGGGSSGGGGGDSNGGGATTTYVSSPSISMPAQCDCKGFTSTCRDSDIGYSMFAGITGALKGAMQALPFFDDVDIKPSGSVSTCTCCDTNGQGLTIDGSLGLQGTASFKLFFVGGEVKTSWQQNGYDLEFTATLGCPLVVPVTFSGYVQGETTCHLGDPKLCGGVSLSIDPTIGCELGGTVKLKQNGQEVGSQGVRAFAEISAGVSGNIQCCTSGGCSSQFCFNGAKASAGVEFEFGNLSFNQKVSIPLADKDCGEEDKTAGVIHAQLLHAVDQAAQSLTGSATASPAVVQQPHQPKDAGSAADGATCATVKLRLEQEAVLARDAFSATLELNNNSQSSRLEGVTVSVDVFDINGRNAKERFGIRLPALTVLTAVDGNGMLPAASSGTASWVLIPTSEAASISATDYLVGGLLSYKQDGVSVAVPLQPVRITVLPVPRLYVDYFHERDVFSDDPFTGVVEPSIPFNLAVMIQNKGYGIAKNFRITSAQPQIVENEKGLLIDFQIIATEVAGRNMVPSLTADFGNLNPGQTAIGRWLMTSTLQGLFIDYSATFEHLDALDGVKLSLLEDVRIHEMIHLVQAAGVYEDGKPDFLVNDIPDPNDLPDTLYLSDGTTGRVQVVTSGATFGTLSASSLVVTQTATMPTGWAYLRAPDPGTGKYQLRRVVRSDGAEICLGTNVWTTDRTFIGMGKRPVYENTLHLLDYNSPGSYTLFYATPSAGDAAAPTSSVAALPETSYPGFPVNWSGTDSSGGSGLAFFDIYVSDNDSPFTPWLQRTALRNAMFQGAQGHSYAFYSRATDAAGNTEPAPATPQAATLAIRTNSAPVFGPVAPQVVNEGQTLALDLPATDPNGDLLRFSFLSPRPPGMSLDETSGRLTWPTAEADGPGTNLLAILVQDGGIPSMSATCMVTVIVNELNQAPMLAPIADRQAKEGQILTFALAGSDMDTPAQVLSYRLTSPSPDGATLTNGNFFFWKPSELQGPSTNVISVVVSDSAIPSLSATQRFTVVVIDTLPDFALRLGTTNLFVGETSAVPIRITSGQEITNLSFMLDLPVARLASLGSKPAIVGVSSSMTSDPSGSNRWTLTLASSAGQNLQGDQTVAWLTFGTDSNLHSAIVPLLATVPSASINSGASLAGGVAVGTRVFLVGREPILDMASPASLRLYGHPGALYGIDASLALGSGSSWTNLSTFILPGRAMDLTQLLPGAPKAFFRAAELEPGASTQPAAFIRTVELEPSVPWLELGLSSPFLTLRLHGTPGTTYDLFRATNILGPWLPFGSVNFTNSILTNPWTNQGEPAQFFRLERH